jgi:hypothetical protein
MRTVLEKEKLSGAIRKLPQDAFTVLEFIEALKKLHPEDWRNLVERFGQFGQGRRYTATTYLSNRLHLYSQEPGSQLRPFTRYNQGKFKDYRRPSEEEKKLFGGSWIAVFREKKKEV